MFLRTRTRAWIGPAVVLVLCGIAARAHGLDYVVCSIDSPCGLRCAAVTGDFQGDGRTDLLVWNGQDVRVFLHSDGAFVRAGEPMVLPEGARLFDAGDSDGDGTDEIVYLAAEGVFALSVDPGRRADARMWVGVACDLPGRYVGPADLVADVDGNGRDDVWFVADDDLRVALSPLPGQATASQPLRLVRGDVRVEPDRMPFRVFLMDVDADYENDLVCVTADGLSVFRIEASSGRFGSAGAWRLPFAPHLEEKDAREFADNRLEDVIWIEDVTADGRPDLMLNSWSRGRVLLFAGSESFFDVQPVHSFEVGAVVTAIGTIPWRSFPRPAVVVSRFEMPGKISTALRLLTGRTVTATMSFLLFEPEGEGRAAYAAEPALVRTARVSAGRGDRSRALPHRLFYTTRADFSGDGWGDLVTLGDSAEIEFYWAREKDEFAGRNRQGVLTLFSRPDPDPMTADEFFEWSHRLILEQVRFRDPDLRVAVPDPTGCTVLPEGIEDLNGDGWPDLLLRYLPVNDERPARLVALLSRPAQ